MNKIKITGSGLYVPGDAIDNAELKRLASIDFDSDKMESKLGIKQRHIAHLRGIKETTADFATKAAEKAIADAGLKADDINLIIVGTDTPEFITPATSILVQGRLQKEEKWTSTFDVSASCASFTIAFDNAVRIMKTDSSIKYAVVIGVYNMPAFIRTDDAFSYPIFADGAGAIVLENLEESKSDYINSQLLTDGTQWDFIGIYSGGAKNPITKEKIDLNDFGLMSLQPMPGDRNVRLWPMVIRKLLQKSKLELNEIDHFIFTQINKSVILKVMDKLGLPYHKTTCIMDKYAYTGSACVPIAFHHALQDGKIKRGDKVMFVTSGAGLAVGSNVFTY
ncbi:MAG: ketoacyl-ACP synthase III [Bacteroidales bacterium]|nr:ketoacyl-ACP synthase III [Bacteroidales bacterium]